MYNKFLIKGITIWLVLFLVGAFLALLSDSDTPYQVVLPILCLVLFMWFFKDDVRKPKGRKKAHATFTRSLKGRGRK